MNKFANKRSRWFLLTVWVFVLALFSDGANLTDLIPGITTVHFEEGDGSFDYFPEHASLDLLTPLYSASLLSRSNSFTRHTVSPPRHVILDQDSPSLAATSGLTSETLSGCTREERQSPTWVYFSESLYLQNHTLLL